MTLLPLMLAGDRFSLSAAEVGMCFAMQVCTYAHAHAHATCMCIGIQYMHMHMQRYLLRDADIRTCICMICMARAVCMAHTMRTPHARHTHATRTPRARHAHATRTPHTRHVHMYMHAYACTSQSLISVLGAAPSAALADRVGPRNVIAPGLGISACAMAAFPLAQDLPQAYYLRTHYLTY